MGGPGVGGVVFKLDRNGRNFEIVHEFDYRPVGEPCWPAGNVIEASDGNLYGTTIGGGTNSSGTIFRLNPNGANFEVIHDFDALVDSGSPGPEDRLLEGRDGKIYGVTRYGGSFGSGTVYRVNKDGSGFEVLHEFDMNSGKGYWPMSALLLGNDGVLYGTLAEDKDYGDLGKIFKMNPDGSGYGVIHDFGSKVGDGANPVWGLTEGRDGALYGTTPLGGPAQGGIIFKLRKDGSHYQVLQSFTQVRFTLGVPFGPLKLAPDGTLYGVTRYGGRPLDAGAVYSLRGGGAKFRIVELFDGGSRDVRSPSGELALDEAGNLFGTSMGGGIANGGTVFRCSLSGTHAVLHTFNSSGGDGSTADSQLSIGHNGLLYGTTFRGGEFGKGTVFQINPNGSGYKILRSLQDPPVGVIMDSASSNLFFTTSGGLFRMKPNGSLKSLHVFRGSPKDGASPGVPLEGSDGILYGTTQGGGQSGVGTIYKMEKSGRDYRVIYYHTGPTNVFQPSDNLNQYLLEGSDGALYCTSAVLYTGAGRVFKLNKDGTGFLTLHTFQGSPHGRLIEGSDGLIYGTTDTAGSRVAYRMNKDGSGFEILHTFGASDWRITGLAEGNDGALYGMSSSNDGAVFRVTKAGDAFSILANAGPSDTEASLVKLLDGSFCGTTTAGGDMNLGQVFRLSPVSNVIILPNEEMRRAK